jgi:SAM-dependent methyltransferase
LFSAAVPTTTWNKRWSVQLTRYLAKGGRAHYGDWWGDPSVTRLGYLWLRLRRAKRVWGNLGKIRRRYLQPYVTSETVVLEIGAGGGRWTRYLMDAREVIVVELNSEFFAYLRNRFAEDANRLRFYETSGYEMDGVDDESVDFVFSFGTFVHIEPDGIDAYLDEIRRVLRPGGIGTLHYADRSKKVFRGKPPGFGGFSNMTAQKMEDLADSHAFEILEHDRRALRHSNVIVLRRPTTDGAAR